MGQRSYLNDIFSSKFDSYSSVKKKLIKNHLKLSRSLNSFLNNPNPDNYNSLIRIINKSSKFLLDTYSEDHVDACFHKNLYEEVYKNNPDKF